MHRQLHRQTDAQTDAQTDGLSRLTKLGGFEADAIASPALAHLP